MTAEDVAALFTRSDGTFLFARWGRPIAAVAFGVEDETLPALKGAIEAVARLAGHPTADVDPELGANFLLFFLRDWAELPDVRGLDRLIGDPAPLAARLSAAGANQYRVFRFDAAGGIRACFAFVRMDADLAALPAQTLALQQAVQAVLLWSDRAFAGRPAFRRSGDGAVELDPGVAAVIRAAYDPVLPVASADAATALRLWARLGRMQ